MKKLINAFLVFSFLLCLGGCGTGKSLQEPDSTVYRSDVQDYIKEVLDAAATIDTFEVTGSVIEDGILTVPCVVVYRSGSDESKGTFTLTYSDNGKTWTLEKCRVDLDQGSTTTAQTSAEELTISDASLYFPNVGSFADLSANMSDVEWSTNAPDIISVSDNGRVTALNGGTAEVYARSNDSVKVCTVTVATHVPSADEIAEANRQLQIVEDYENQNKTYSYSEVQKMYDDFIKAGNTVPLYTEVIISQCDNATVACVNFDWYNELHVSYYSSGNGVVYLERYYVVTDNSLNTNCPTYWQWFTADVDYLLFSVNTEKASYYCYHNPQENASSWAFFETQYIDGIAVRSLVIY